MVNSWLNSQGQKQENKDEILIKEYARYCKELLKIRPASRVYEERRNRTNNKRNFARNNTKGKQTGK